MNKKTKKIPLFDLKINKEAKSETSKVLNSGWLSSGKYVLEFEEKVKNLLDIPYAAPVSSATDGLIMALLASGIGRGDEVITSPFTFVATIEAIMAVGAQVVFADIDYQTLTISPEEIEKKINKKSKAVITVDIAGYPSDYEKISRICKKKNLTLISDSAHAIGTKLNNRSIPHYTNASVISFHATKNLTCGEGGMVFSKSKKLINTVKLLSSHGLTSSAYTRKNSDSPFYNALLCGMKGNMSELNAAVGCGQLKTFASEQKKRDSIFKRYLKNLKDVKKYIELPELSKNIQHGYHLFIIKNIYKSNRISRKRLTQLLSQNGIETGLHYRPIFELTYYKNLPGVNRNDYPETVKAGKSVITLPLYPHLSLSDVDYISKILTDIVSKKIR